MPNPSATGGNYTPPTGGASITDILTALKNVSTAINGWTTTQQTLAGTQNLANITAATLIKAGPGRFVGISIVVQGSTEGYVYDANSVSAAAAVNKIYPVLHTKAIDYYPTGIPTALGLVVIPGTGQTLAVNYA